MPRSPVHQSTQGSRVRHLLGKLLLLSLVGLLCFASWLVSDPDIPHGGDPFEDRRGLLRNVPDSVLRDVANGIHFRGAVVVEAVQNNQNDIWLIETSRFGTKTRLITDSTANETDPVWSADGKWVAYLSDATRPGGRQGKPEVFVHRLEDGKTIQITNAPAIDWHGPLDWLFDNMGRSYDGSGEWKTGIVLTGSIHSAPPGDLSASGIYHIPVNGPNRQPVLLAKTQGAAGLVRSYSQRILFGTSDGKLAFIANPARQWENVELSELEKSGAVVATQAEYARGLVLVPGAFDWTGTGASEMIYLTRGDPPDGEVGVEVGIAWLSYDSYSDSSSMHYIYEGFKSRPALSGRLGTLQTIISIGNSKLLALQDGPLDGSGSTGCLGLYFYNLAETPVKQGRPPFFSDLCLDALPDGFHPQNEIYEQNIKHQYWAVWRVFSGRRSGESASSLYATLVFNDQRYLDLKQLRPIAAHIKGEIVPGSMRIRPISQFSREYQEEVSRLIDPQPAP